MNFLTEYKDEVGSLCLSAEFKENLKKACIAEAAKAVGEDEKPRRPVSGNLHKKLKVSLFTPAPGAYIIDPI